MSPKVLLQGYKTKISTFKFVLARTGSPPSKFKSRQNYPKLSEMIKMYPKFIMATP